MQATGRLPFTGLGGWEHEALDACLYPVPAMESGDKLRFYARYFSAVEVRSTFWDESLGAPDARAWADTVAFRKDFCFIPKLHAALTHGRTLTSPVAARQNELCHELQAAGKLGAVLAQFPLAFTNTSANRYFLGKLAALFGGLPVHIEVRHASWNTPSFLSLLDDLGLRPVSSDLPRMSPYFSFQTRTAGTQAYLRLHGRNSRGWMVREYDARYDYLYNAKELLEIRRRCAALPPALDRVLVLWNNTTGGKAVANAFQFLATLRGEAVPIPQKTLTAFPELQRCARPSDTGPDLFTEEPYKQVI
jgi:uncharacterized protein YecE (DUF72 family)